MPPVGKHSQKGPRAIPIDLVKRGTVQIYAGLKIAHALEELKQDTSLYKGVRLQQVIEAAYEQGRKDGAREVFEKLDVEITHAKKEIPFRNPGKPRKK